MSHIAHLGILFINALVPLADHAGDQGEDGGGSNGGSDNGLVPRVCILLRLCRRKCGEYNLLHMLRGQCHEMFEPYL